MSFCWCVHPTTRWVLLGEFIRVVFFTFQSIFGVFIHRLFAYPQSSPTPNHIPYLTKIPSQKSFSCSSLVLPCIVEEELENGVESFLALAESAFEVSRLKKLFSRWMMVMMAAESDWISNPHSCESTQELERLLSTWIISPRQEKVELRLVG